MSGWKPRRFLPLLLAVGILAGCGERQETLPLTDKIGNVPALVAGIRTGLREHARSITVRLDSEEAFGSGFNSAIEEWVEAALAETDDPAEGDYLRCQFGGYTWESDIENDGDIWHYSVRIVPDYYDYAVQEEAVTAVVSEKLEAFAFHEGDTDAEKIYRIYDDLCRSVSYDAVHRKNPYSHLKSTAYGALVLRSATCQGYCAALYRLLRSCGISCRIVQGTAGDEKHAWVIAGVDGVYYNLDPTWDAGAEEYGYFLRGSADFTDHVPDARFQTREYRTHYPMAEQSYRKEGSQ